MVEQFMDYAIEKDLCIEDLITLHDEHNYAVVIGDGKIKDFIYEGEI